MSLSKVSVSYWQDPTTKRAYLNAYNPRIKQGTVSVLASMPGRVGIGGVLAAKVSIEKALSVLEVGDKPPQPSLEEAFKEANIAAYNFGHELASAGKVSASLLGLLSDGEEVSVGRVGGGEAYLYRNFELFPFFDEPPKDFEWYLGGASLVSVQLSTITLQPEDIVILLSDKIHAFRIGRLLDFMDEAPLEPPYNLSELLKREVFPGVEEQSFVAVISFGKSSIFLRGK